MLHALTQVQVGTPTFASPTRPPAISPHQINYVNIRQLIELYREKYGEDITYAVIHSNIRFGRLPTVKLGGRYVVQACDIMYALDLMYCRRRLRKRSSNGR